MLALLLVHATVPQAHSVRRDCPEQASESGEGEIVVCAERDADERYRLKPLPPRYVETPEIDVALPGGGGLAPRVEQGRLGDPQIKLHLRMPF